MSGRSGSTDAPTHRALERDRLSNAVPRDAAPSTSGRWNARRLSHRFSSLPAPMSQADFGSAGEQQPRCLANGHAVFRRRIACSSGSPGARPRAPRRGGSCS
jgi:hypothetical protein